MSMANPLPPMEFDALPLDPAPYGLYDAATPTDLSEPTPGSGTGRIFGGVHIRPLNCSEAFGTWPTDPCAAPPVDTFKEGDRPTSDTVFDPVLPWAYEECDPLETDAASQARALQTLNLQERLLVESAFATQILADAGGPLAATSLIEAVGKLEEALGEAGYVGNIHAARRWASEAASVSLLKSTASAYRTVLGSAWVFGGGYAGVLGDTLVATGPVYIWRYAPIVNTALDPSINRRASVAERLVVVGYECIVAAVTIT
jgi:hypothetical protein